MNELFCENIGIVSYNFDKEVVLSKFCNFNNEAKVYG